MNPLTIILDSDPETTVMWRQWDVRKATIKGELLTVHWGHGDLFIEAEDPQLICDMVFSHDQKKVLVKGKLGVKSVRYTEKPKEETPIAALRKILNDFMNSEDE